MQSVESRSHLAVALDVEDGAAALALAERVAPFVGCFKVGLELFCAEGPAIVERIGKLGPVFLDLKLHDIPTTMARAASRLRHLPVRFLTVHAAAGRQALEATVEAAQGITVLAVTVLTSLETEDLAREGIHAALPNVVDTRAQFAERAGCGGIVCSPQEATRLRSVLAPHTLIVTPGIRPAGAAAGDQQRAMDPHSAILAGADLLVVGRPIRDAADPAAAARAICEAIEQARKERRATVEA